MRSAVQSAFVVFLLACAMHDQKPELVVEIGHTGAVNSVAFSPDGSQGGMHSTNRTGPPLIPRADSMRRLAAKIVVAILDAAKMSGAN